MKKTSEALQIPDPNRYVVNIRWDADDGGFVATVPALPGCVCVMPDEGAAIREIRAIIKAALEIFAEKGVPMPAPDSGEVEVIEEVTIECTCVCA
jgi:predicted RNase H-like HicB family nuclease